MPSATQQENSDQPHENFPVFLSLARSKVIAAFTCASDIQTVTFFPSNFVKVNPRNASLNVAV